MTPRTLDSRHLCFIFCFAFFCFSHAAGEAVAPTHSRSLVDVGPSSTTKATVPVFPGTKDQYKTVLGLSWLFYEAQQSGRLPKSNRISWRKSSHITDLVPGGWYDAGDHLKLNMPMSYAVANLAWSVLDFQKAYQQAGQLDAALNSLRWAADYLMRCHTKPYEYVGQIGDPGVDHAYWGRPDEQTGPRPATIYNAKSKCADLLGAVSAALASCSLVFKANDPAFANSLLDHAQQLYAWGSRAENAGTVASSRYHDKLTFAAAWLFRATRNSAYLRDADRTWTTSPELFPNIYPSSDCAYPAAANLLLSLAANGAKVPGIENYRTWFRDSFLDNWQYATGGWDIKKTPKGFVLIAAEWAEWGSLRYTLNAAFQLLLHAKYTKGPTGLECIAWAWRQIDYALGSSGRSYVVGWGVNPPTHAHHRGASCPNRPAKCTWDNFDTPKANPQVLFGALVGGPDRTDSYADQRDDYRKNEVAVDFNAGFTGALAGLIELLPA